MKMKMKEVDDLVDSYSSKASEYCHQLGMAGIVIIWTLYSVKEKTNISDLSLISIAFLMFIISLTISLAHYFVLAILSDNFSHKNEKRLKSKGIDSIEKMREEEVEENIWIEKLSHYFFWSKVMCLLSGYVLTIIFILQYIFK